MNLRRRNRGHPILKYVLGGNVAHALSYVYHCTVVAALFVGYSAILWLDVANVAHCAGNNKKYHIYCL